MDRRKLICLLVCGGFLLGYARNLFPKSSSSNDSLASPLKVEIIGVKDQLYCKNQADLYTVYAKTEVTITNTSSRDVILSKTLSPAFRVRVSLSVKNAQQAQFVYNPSPYEVSKREPKLPHFGSTPDPTLFATLRSGAKYTASIWAPILADLSTKQNLQQPGMTSGDFVIEIFVQTWPYSSLSETQFESVKNKWSHQGEVLNQVIPSNFYPLSLPMSPIAPSCEKFRTPNQE